jgi:serine protease Do
MNLWKTTVLTATLVAVGATGAPFAPAVHGQARAERAPVARARVIPAQESSAVQFMRSGGSEIGVTIRDLSDEETKGTKAAARGAVITAITPGGPAESAGMKQGDIVTDFDGERVRSARQFARIVEETPVGRRVDAAVNRDGQRMTMNVQTRSGRSGFRLLSDMAPRMRDFGVFNFDMPSPPTPPAPPTAPAPRGVPAPPATPPAPALPDVFRYFSGSASRLGITVDDLSSQLAEYFGTKDGVLVSSVTDNSVAAKAGLKAGDVITSVNGEPVTSASELRRRIQRLDEGAEFTIGVLRDKKPMTLKGKLEPRAERVRTYIS